jgi:hypothetical protein
MHTVIDPCKDGGVVTVEPSGGKDAAPATITTTLYDLIAALQEVVDPGEVWFVSYRGGFPPDNVAQIPLKPLSIQRNDAKGSAT